MTARTGDSHGRGGWIALGVVAAVAAGLLGAYLVIGRVAETWTHSYDSEPVTATSAPVVTEQPGTDADADIAPGSADAWHGTAPPGGGLQEDDVVAAVARLPESSSADRAQADAIRAVEGVVPPSAHVQAERSDDALVVTAGIAGTQECVVAVRTADGEAFLFSDFDRILLAPGEGGCGPYLYLNPVTTH